jgi:hypothetical protein
MNWISVGLLKDVEFVLGGEPPSLGLPRGTVQGLVGSCQSLHDIVNVVALGL